MTSNQDLFYKNRLSHIIEIIGPAGSGKTTLAKALGQHDNIKLIEYPPYYRKYKDLPFFTRNTVETIPTILKLNLLRNGKGLARWDMAVMVILQGWHRVQNQ
jgi:uridine kinase